MANIKRVVRTSFAFYFIFFVAFAVGFGTPGWMRIDNAISGLWQACIVYDGWNCDAIGDGGSMFNTVRGLASAGALFYLIGFVLHCAWLSKSRSYLDEHGAGSIGKAALSLQISGCVFSAVAVILYGVESIGTFEPLERAFSFWLVCGSTLLIFINATATLGSTACCFKSDSIGVATSRQPFISNQPISDVGAQQAPPSSFDNHSPHGGAVFTTPAEQRYQAPPPSMYPQQPQPQPQSLYPQMGQHYPQNNYPPQSTNIYLPRPSITSQLDHMHQQPKGGYPNNAFGLQPSAPKLEPNPDYLY